MKFCKANLAMEEGGYGEIPSSVSGHGEAQKWPNSVVVERWNKYCGRTAGSEYVRPCPLVKLIVYVIYVAATSGPSHLYLGTLIEI